MTESVLFCSRLGGLSRVSRLIRAPSESEQMLQDAERESSQVSQGKQRERVWLSESYVYMY